VSKTLTPRQTEILRWAAEGLLSREIADLLNISKRTVDVHIVDAIQNLGARNRTHAVAIALRKGIIN
jgi:LuxR family transcriptional regulator, quorum-sensing system regulator BjaR1